MPPRATVILNSRAGADRNKPTLRELADAFQAAGLEVVVEAATGPEITALARQARDAGVPLIVAAGGDGTVSSVASVLAGSEVVLGIVPLGTLNHFAKTLRIPTDVVEAVQVIAAGHRAAVDVGEVNRRIFINTSSLGAYPRLVLEREREEQKGRSYAVSFAVAVLRVWRDYRRVRVAVQVEGERRVVRSPFVFVGNNEYQLEGVKTGARARLDAGCLHLCMAPDMTRADVFRVLLAALAGRLEAVDHFESIVTTECAVDAWRRQVMVSLDGEIARLTTPLEYRIRPSALHVMTPEQAG